MSIEAITRALDWLETHPDQHITGEMAINDNGCDVPPSDPNAVCFCALGRIAKEAGIVGEEDENELYPYRSLDKFLEPYGVNCDDVWELNDGASAATASLSKTERLAALRQLFTQEG